MLRNMYDGKIGSFHIHMDIWIYIPPIKGNELHVYLSTVLCNMEAHAKSLSSDYRCMPDCLEKIGSQVLGQIT